MNERILALGKRVLVLCPHTDDEFGCAGTIIRFVEAGAEVRYLALSRCEISVPHGYEKDALEQECRRCTHLLGLKDSNVEIAGFPVRHFPQERQAILEKFYRLNKEFQPEVVLLPSSFDNHQDHATVSTEGFRAFKNSTLLGYELPQNVTAFENSALVTLTEDHMNRKLEALSAYQSQLFRPYASPDYIRGLARVRGVQCASTYAEAFEGIKFVIR